MFLRDSVWLLVRDRLTAEEIEAVKAARQKRRCCPPGVYLNDEALGPVLIAKLIMRMS